MTPETLLLLKLALPAAGLAVGGLAAQLNAPFSCNWPARRDELMERLREVQAARRIGPARSMLATLCLTGLLFGGAAAAYAARPTTPIKPPTRAVSAAGKSSQASPKAKTSASAASANKGKASSAPLPAWRVVTSTEDAASRIKGVYSAADQTVLNNHIAWGRWDGKPFPGLTLDQTRRTIIYVSKAKLNDLEWADRLDMARQERQAERQRAIDIGYDNYVRYVDGLEAIGPDSIYVPKGTTMDNAARAVGLEGAAGYVSGSIDGAGGFTMTKAPARGHPLFEGFRPALREVLFRPAPEHEAIVQEVENDA